MWTTCAWATAAFHLAQNNPASSPPPPSIPSSTDSDVSFPKRHHLSFPRTLIPPLAMAAAATTAPPQPPPIAQQQPSTSHAPHHHKYPYLTPETQHRQQEEARGSWSRCGGERRQRGHQATSRGWRARHRRRWTSPMAPSSLSLSLNLEASTTMLLYPLRRLSPPAATFLWVSLWSLSSYPSPFLSTRFI